MSENVLPIITSSSFIVSGLKFKSLIQFEFIYFFCIMLVVVVKSPCRVWLFATPGTAAHQASLSLTISWSLRKFMSIALVMPSSHLILWLPLLFLPLIFPVIGLFQWVSFSHQMTKILKLQLQYQSFQWVFRVISLKIDWFDLLAVQGTLMSLLQHHSSKASILQLSAFFMVQLSQLYVTTGKTIALTKRTFVFLQFHTPGMMMKSQEHIMVCGLPLWLSW